MKDFQNNYYKEICEKALFDYTYMSYNTFLLMYNESHRYFHTIEHLEDNFKYIGNHNSFFFNNDIIVLTNIFHDIIYYPHLSNNEYRSIKLLKENWKFSANLTVFEEVKTCIEDTKNRKNSTFYCAIFNKADTSILYTQSRASLIRYEDQIRKEYDFLNPIIYKKERIKFLESMSNEKNLFSIGLIVDYIKNPAMFNEYPHAEIENSNIQYHEDIFGLEE